MPTGRDEKLEAGKRLPRLDTILVLCDVFKVAPNELLHDFRAGYEPKLPLP